MTEARAPVFAVEGVAILNAQKVDFHGASWEAIKEYVHDRIADLHRRAEDLSLDDRDRRDHMARIAELRELIGNETVAPLKRATKVDYNR